MTEAERGERVKRFLRQVRGGLIVSCQALPDEPLYGAELMARMVRAALEAGATAVVVGGEITRPQEITARFVNALNLFAGPISRPGSGRGS